MLLTLCFAMPCVALAGVGSFVLASLGMTFLGAIGAIREFGKSS